MRWEGEKGGKVVRWEKWENGEAEKLELPGFYSRMGDTR